MSYLVTDLDFLITWLNSVDRELHEESGLCCDKLSEVGRLMFEFVGDPQLLEVHVFTGTDYKGTPTESEGQ